MSNSLFISVKNKWNNPEFQKYFKNTLWLFSEKFIRLGVGFFVGVLVARYLGPKNFGILSYAQSVVFLLLPIASLGIDSIVVRELVYGKDNQYIILTSAFILKLFGLFLYFFILYILVKLLNNSSYVNNIIFIISLSVIFEIFKVIESFFQSKTLLKYISLSELTSFFTVSILKIFFIIIKFPLLFFALSYPIERFLASLGYLYFFYKDLARYDNPLKYPKFWKSYLLMIKKLLKWGLPIVFSGFAISIYMKIDQIIIQKLLGSYYVGQYSIAVRLTEIFLFIPVLITKSISPSVYSLKSTNSELYYNRLLFIYRFFIAISLFISFLIFILSEKIVNIIYGKKYLLASKILKIYIWSNIFVYMNNASWLWYIAENLQYLASIRLILGATVNIVLNLIFIPKYGIVGAAWTTVISYAIAAYFGNLISKKTLVNFKLLTRALFTFWKIFFVGGKKYAK